jgi:hypothetical protein
MKNLAQRAWANLTSIHCPTGRRVRQLSRKKAEVIRLRKSNNSFAYAVDIYGYRART